MKAISLHQPHAGLCVTRQAYPVCGGCSTYQHDVSYHDPSPMVKRFETRSWPCPPALIGQRIAIHATKRRPVIGGHDYGVITPTNDGRFGWQPLGDDGEYGAPELLLPLGAVVGSAVVTASLPILSAGVDDAAEEQVTPFVFALSDGSAAWQYADSVDEVGADLADQVPYGDFTPGRYAWIIEDAAPTTERCPGCRGQGDFFDPELLDDWMGHVCPVCDGAGRCEPIPAVGRQRIWNWTT